jgi:threonine dehydrogenase-like Zn-dependent dehydrogenase
MTRETLTLTQKEQHRVHILTQVQHGAVQAHEAARLLGLSVRHLRRLLARLRNQGLAALAHGNRGRPSPGAHGVEVPIETVIFRNIGLRGGVSPVRRYIPELLDDVLEGRINPGRVFDFATDLNGIVEAYTAMNERCAVKSLLRIGRI